MRNTMKYRIYSTKYQQSPLDEKLTFCYLVYNQALAYRKEAWEQRQRLLSLYETHALLARWKREQPALFAVHSLVLQNVQERICLAHIAFFRRFEKGTTPDTHAFVDSVATTMLWVVFQKIFFCTSISVSHVWS